MYEAYSESPGVKEMCSSQGVTICRHLKYAYNYQIGMLADMLINEKGCSSEGVKETWTVLTAANY